MKYKIKSDFWTYLALSGENIKTFRYRVHLCDITWRKIKNGGVITKSALITFQQACAHLISDFREFQFRFVDEVVSKQKIQNSGVQSALREKLVLLHAKGLVKYSDLANYLGTSKQYVYNFIQGQYLGKGKQELLEKYISLFENMQ